MEDSIFIKAFNIGNCLVPLMFVTDNNLIYESILSSLNIDKSIINGFIFPCESLSSSLGGVFLLLQKKKLLILPFKNFREKFLIYH